MSENRKGFVSSWVDFWFSPADPVGLHALRVLGGLLFLAWLLPFATDPGAFFGLNGWYDATAYYETSQMSELPPHMFSWSVIYLCGTSAPAIAACYWLSIAIIGLYTAGVWTRLTSVLTWVIVVSFTANPVTSWDADPYLRMVSFYTMVGYLLIGQRVPGLSWSERLLGLRQSPTTSVAATLAVRLFQVNFAIAMIASGLHKLQAREWWSGLAFWYTYHTPFHTTPGQVEAYQIDPASSLFNYSLATYAILAWQIGFPGFAWKRSLRVLLLGGAAVAFIANVFVLHLPLIGPVMVVGCLSFLTAAEWRWALDRLPSRSSVGTVAAPAAAKIKLGAKV